MPIRPENRDKYPANWKQISRYIREVRAEGRCEGLPGGEPCWALNGELHPVTGSIVVLTVAHLNHEPSDVDGMDVGGEPVPLEFSNLRALCQQHHLEWDMEIHVLNRKVNAHSDAGPDMFQKELDSAVEEERERIRQRAIETLVEFSDEESYEESLLEIPRFLRRLPD